MTGVLIEVIEEFASIEASSVALTTVAPATVICLALLVDGRLPELLVLSMNAVTAAWTWLVPMVAPTVVPLPPMKEMASEVVSLLNVAVIDSVDVAVTVSFPAETMIESWMWSEATRV